MTNIEDLQTLPPHERELHLKAMACKVENGTYFKPFTAEELEGNKDAYTDFQVELGDAEDQFKEETKAMRTHLKSLKERNRRVLLGIRHKGETVTGITYLVDDQQAGVMHTLDAQGALISTRKLRPDEQQSNLFNKTTLKQAANGD